MYSVVINWVHFWHIQALEQHWQNCNYTCTCIVMSRKLLFNEGKLIVSNYVCSRIDQSTDCRIFWPRRPLSAAYKTLYRYRCVTICMHVGYTCVLFPPPSHTSPRRKCRRYWISCMRTWTHNLMLAKMRWDGRSESCTVLVCVLPFSSHVSRWG